MKRKIIKAAALIVCTIANGAVQLKFGLKAWALTAITLIAFAIWVAVFYAEREEEAVADMAEAIVDMISGQDEPEENI